MADNTRLPQGTEDGDIYASDDIGGIKHQRVKIEIGPDGSATDVSGANPLPVSDNGGSFTVDAPVTTPVFVRLSDGTSAITSLSTTLSAAIPAGANTIGTVNVGTLPALATGANVIGRLAANSGVDIGDVDVTSLPALATGANTIGSIASVTTSITPGTGAANLGKAEDAAHTTGDVGVMMLGVRQDADSSPVSASGDYHAPMFDNAGNLKVAIKAGAGTGGFALADGASFTRDTTSMNPAGAVVETSAPTLTNGDAAALSMTTGGALRVAVTTGGIPGVIEDNPSAGGEEGLLCMAVRQDSLASNTSADGDFSYLKVSSNGSLYVTGGGGGTQYQEDVAHASGDTGTLALAVRRDTAAVGSGTDGDYSTLNVDASGRLHVNVGALPASTNTIEIVGDVAADAAVAGNPVLVGYRASTATPTAMSGDGDSVHAWADRNGATVVTGRLVDDSAFTPGTDRVVAVGYTADEASTDSVDEGDIGAARMTLDRKQISANYAHTAGGWTPHRLISAATTNATSLKASAGQVGSIICSNVNAAMRYLKLYNLATAPTVGTSTPVHVIPIPGNTAGAGCVVNFGAGLEFTTGIAYALTTGITDADTGAVAASEITVSIAYK